MIEVLELPFMQRALAAAALIGALAGYYGAFVVQRGLSFLGDGLAHAAFGGVALGLLLGAEPLWVSLPFTIAVALAIAGTRRISELGGDTAVGIFKAAAMALGIVFLSARTEYSADAMSYLFGSLLSVTEVDLAALGFAFLLGLASLGLWGRWAYATFDRELAQSDKLRVDRDDAVLFTLIAVTVVVSVKVVGAVLATSSLVLPAATARLFARRFASMTALAALHGCVTSIAGLILAYYADLPGGAAIILLQTAIFIGCGIVRRKS